MGKDRGGPGEGAGGQAQAAPENEGGTVLAGTAGAGGPAVTLLLLRLPREGEATRTF